MGVTLVNPSLDRAGRGGGRTAFERNILPTFARWVIEQIEIRQPDYLIPAETKGARVLEAVLRYAREELATPIAVPVLYGTALAYLDPAELSSKRLMLVDDAVRTGGNLAHHRRRAQAYGACDVEAIACIGAGDGKRRDVDCFLVVGEDLYREYVWQLTELVVARGLPPEVDHHIYEVRLPNRLAGSWESLVELLSGFGTLTIDGPIEKRQQLLPMTLHFPRLPGREASDPTEEFREVDKLRFFPDLDHECFYAVPVVFPPLRVSAAGENRTISRGEARELIPTQRCGPGSVGELLIDEAKTLNAKTLFRANSTAAEVESLAGLARVLAGSFPGVSIAAHPDSFARLYGPRCGASAAERVAAQIAGALESTGSNGLSVAGDRREPVFLDREVADTTRTIVKHLRDLYADAMAAGRDRSERIGLSVPEIQEFLPDASALLISRCIDFGMAMTALVPFASYEERQGGVLIERAYRVSEPLRSEELPYEDIGDARVELSEQTVAVIAHNVIERSPEEVGSADPDLLSALIAILRPLVLEGHSIPLKVLPGDNDPEIILTDDDRLIRIEEKTSVFFDYDRESGGYVPTPHFLGLYEKGTLPVEVRKSVEDIEARLRVLLPLLDGLAEGERGRLLDGWRMSTDHRLGLSYVRHALDAALLRFATSLRQVRRGRTHDHDSGISSEASDRARAATEMLDVLSGEWQAPAVDQWSDRLALERHFRASLACPEKPLALYELPAAVADLIAELGMLVEHLDGCSASYRAEPDADHGSALELARLTVELAARARQVLASFDDSPLEFSRLAVHDTGEALAAAAAELELTVKMARALLAALAGAYRGPENAHLRQPTELRRHVAVLSLDISGSRAHRHSHPQTHDAWKNEGLNIAAQFARALGGWEGRNRFGDDLLIEFEGGDAAILCAALAQCHAEALRSTGLDTIGRRFHAGVDCGQIVTQTGGSNDGDCMDRVTFVAKECDDDSATIDVYATSDAWSFCSTAMQGQDIQVRDFHKQITVDKGQTMIAPVAIDSRLLLGRYTERLAEFSRELAGRVAAAGAQAPHIDIGPADADQEDSDQAAGSAG